MDETVALKQKQAKLIGFNNYAEVSLETKMAESTTQVLDFLTDLAQKARPFAIKELAALKKLAKEDFWHNSYFLLYSI